VTKTAVRGSDGASATPSAVQTSAQGAGRNGPGKRPAPDLSISRTLKLPIDIVTEALGIVATRGAGKSYTSAVLIEEAHGAGVPFLVVDPSGAYWGLRSNASGDGPGLPVYVFGGEHGDLPLDPYAGAFFAELVVDSGHSFVLDLSDLTKTQARKFVADLLERLYERKARNRTTLLLVIDEADEFAPQLIRDKRGGDAPRCLGAVETVTKRGRRRGLGVVLITQRTQALNKDVLDLIETLIAMRQLAERSREAVKGWIADKELRDDAGVIESLQALPTGEAWVWSPLRGILKRVKVRRIRTFDSYKTPEPGEDVVEPAARAEIDLDALGEQMASTVERAKENDPSELRRRIKELESRPAVDESEVAALKEEVEELRARPPEQITVAVLTEGDRSDLRRAVNALERTSEQLAVSATDAVKVIETLVAKADAAVEKTRPADPPRPRTTSQRTPEPRAPAQPAPEAARPQTGESGGASLLNRKAERAILAVLAQYPQGRTQTQVAILAGYSKRGGGFTQAVAKLRRLAFIEGRDHLTITAEGLEAIEGQWEPLPTGPALLNYWLGQMKRAAERRVLEVLYQAWPESLHQTEVAARAGYEPKGGGFTQAVAKLRRLELIEGSGDLRASDDLRG
jgi:polyhydroxyalkanoate synthesis regulator phasin